MGYKFDPIVLERVCNEVIARKLEGLALFDALIERLASEYPGLVGRRRRRWLGSKAGGILGKLTFLYVGFTEYLLIFGSPCGTQGFSGRYNFLEVHKVLLAGRIVSYDLETDQIDPTVLLPGAHAYMKKGEARGLTIHAGSWHLEYARGPNITAMPFGLAETLLSSVELRTFWLTMSEYTRLILRRWFS